MSVMRKSASVGNSSLLGAALDAAGVAVERALAEFRSGRPVLIEGDDAALLVYAVELTHEDMLARSGGLASGMAHLILPAARLRRLGADRKSAGIIALPELDLARITMLSLKTEARIDAPVGPASRMDLAALELSSLSLVLPPVIAVPVKASALSGQNVVSVTVEALESYRGLQTRLIRIVGRAPVPLEGATDTEFVVFRGGEGLRDQVAIIVGKPDLNGPVPVRLHSACLTGDLFGSLKCDCGDQLRETVRWMAEGEGGILLYLDQEGRGNGISNKMRAYRLQSEGWDTYDADEVLGFEFDQRHFAFAAEMLRQLGVTAVTALTNNPEKIKALKAAGLDVAASQRVIGRPTAQNVRYLASKRDRAGHDIDFEALMARAVPTA